MIVRVEVAPPLTEVFGYRGTGRLVIEQTMKKGNLADLLNTLIREYPGFGEYALELGSVVPVCPHVLVALNNEIITVRNKLNLALRNGDVLILLPEFLGG